MNSETLLEDIKKFALLFRYGTKEKLFGFIGLSLIGLAAGVPKLIDSFLKDYQHLSQWIVLGLYILGGLCLSWVAYRFVFKLAWPKPHDDRELPNAIKGLLAFTQEDGELFRKLGRDQDIKSLTALVQDPQIPLVVIMGESGAGKSSLLRAGLANSIKPAEGVYIYWEALPHNTVEGLLRAVNSGLNSDYADLIGLLKMPQKAVIVLDQFEQLQPENPDHQPIFELLGKVYSAPPPHPVTWCIAFRREYAAVWRDFELDHGVRPPMLSLKLFSAEQARNIFITLAEAAGLSLEQDLVDGFVESVKRVANGEQQPRVSPVDIGIGLQMLNELAQSKQTPQLGLQDYNFAGGSQGLFVSFLNNAVTQRFPETAEREALYKVLLECIDLSRNQRIAEGKTEAELAASSPNLPTTHLHYALEYFASPQLRILEKLQGEPPRYRLPHETMIPALRQLGGKLLGEVAEAELLLQTAYASWQNSGNNRKYLLSGRELKKVIGCKQQLDLHERGKFVKKSQRKRQAQLMMVIAVLALTPFVGYYGYQSYLEDKYRNALNNWGLPGDLIDYAGQLQSLRLAPDDQIRDLKWLADFTKLTTLHLELFHSKIMDLSPLRELKPLTTLTLDLDRSDITQISGLRELKPLTTLTLFLGGSSITDLSTLRELKQLSTLTLYLNNSAISDFSTLRELKQLTTLTLDLEGSAIRDFSTLRELKPLTTLTLHLDELKINEFIALRELQQLATLTLYLRFSPITQLSALQELKQLTTLTLHLKDSEITDLSVLRELKQLKTLTLDLWDSSITDLGFLRELNQLTTLSLDLRNHTITDLGALRELKQLNTLTLQLSTLGITDLGALRELKQLTNLTLNLSGHNITDLGALRELKQLISLNLDLSSSNVTDLSVLQELNQLKTLNLNLYGTKIADLSTLRELKQLSTLTLVLHFAEITDLSVLQELKQLTTLTLDLESSKIADLSVLRELKPLTTLTLLLVGSGITDLSTLRELKQLTTLKLDLSLSNLTDLSALHELKQLTTLKLDIQHTKINSLKGLPTLTELKMGN